MHWFITLFCLAKWCLKMLVKYFLNNSPVFIIFVVRVCNFSVFSHYFDLLFLLFSLIMMPDRSCYVRPVQNSTPLSRPTRPTGVKTREKRFSPFAGIYLRMYLFAGGGARVGPPSIQLGVGETFKGCRDYEV